MNIGQVLGMQLSYLLNMPCTPCLFKRGLEPEGQSTCVLLVPYALGGKKSSNVQSPNRTSEINAN